MEPLILQAAGEDTGKRLDAWLAEQTELTRSAAQKLLEEGRVTAGGKPLAKNTRLTGAETVSVLLPEPELPSVPVLLRGSVPVHLPARLCQAVCTRLLSRSQLHTFFRLMLQRISFLLIHPFLFLRAADSYSHSCFCFYIWVFYSSSILTTRNSSPDNLASSLTAARSTA